MENNRNTDENENRNEWQNADNNEQWQQAGATEDEEVDLRDDDDTDEEAEESRGDWGNVDPQSNPGGFPDSNEPSAPGSAV